MTSLKDRLFNMAVAADEEGNAIGGGKANETISGTVGRALIKGSVWAKPASALIDGIFGQGHCANQAAKEAAMRAARAALTT